FRCSRLQRPRSPPPSPYTALFRSEDAFRLWPAEGVVPPKSEGGGLLAVLADGMGGHTGGAIAGQTACKTFTEVFSATSAPLEARDRKSIRLNSSHVAISYAVFCLN